MEDIKEGRGRRDKGIYLIGAIGIAINYTFFPHSSFLRQTKQTINHSSLELREAKVTANG
jgi:hypothetical protein